MRTAEKKVIQILDDEKILISNGMFAIISPLKDVKQDLIKLEMMDFEGNISKNVIQIDLNPYIRNTQIMSALKTTLGYFIKDRLVIGVNPNLYLWNSKFNYTNYPNLNNGTNNNGSSIGLGLFTRYYLLNNNQNYNFIGEVSYGLDKFTDEDTYLKKTSISIGPVLFLNKNTSLDFLLNYTNTSKNYTNNKIGNDIISFNVGFQIYL
jgi:hypothetical protein